MAGRSGVKSPAAKRCGPRDLNRSLVVREICLAVRPAAPYAVTLTPQQVEAEPGTAVLATAKVDRHWPDFKGKVQLTAFHPPPYLSMATTDLPANQVEVPIKIKVAPNTPPGTYSVTLLADAQVPFSADPKCAGQGQPPRHRSDAAFNPDREGTHGQEVNFA